ncbi:MAG: hypothetical protein ACQESG_03530, partial [Nanobdellota archaeon]
MEVVFSTVDCEVSFARLKLTKGKKKRNHIEKRRDIEKKREWTLREAEPTVSTVDCEVSFARLKLT